MRASLIINGHEIGGYIAEDGLKFNPIARNEKTIITKNGSLYKHSINKCEIEVTLLNDMFDQYYEELNSYFAPNPATVSYSDFKSGLSGSGTFFIEDKGVSAKKSIGTETLLSGASFVLIPR